MTNPYYTPTGQPSNATRGRSTNVREEFALIAYAFDLVEAAKVSSANPAFTGYISGDFSNATIASRLLFRSSTTNGATGVTAVPNGTSRQAGFAGFSGVSANESLVYSYVDATAGEVGFSSDKTGTGTYLPMKWFLGGAERMHMTTDGLLGIGVAANSNIGLYVRRAVSSTASDEFGSVIYADASNASGSATKYGVSGLVRAVTGYASSGQLVGARGRVQLLDAVTVASAVGVMGAVDAAAAGSVTNVSCFQNNFGNTGGATFGTMQGYYAIDIALNNYWGFYALVSSGTGKRGVYSAGTAQNTFIGVTTVGTNTANTSGAKLQTSDGLTFPATQVPSSDANTLDDYEEGTWTPTDASGAALSFVQAVGAYVKVGRLVLLTAYIEFPATADTSQVKIGGRPFSEGGFGTTASASIGYTNSGFALNAIGAASSTVIWFYRDGSASLTNADMSGKIVQFSLTYISSN